jgi:hypothetical protein
MKRVAYLIIFVTVLSTQPTLVLSFNLSDSVYVRKNEIQREIPPVLLMPPTIALPTNRLNRLGSAYTKENGAQEEVSIRTFQPSRQWQLTGGYRANMYNEKRTNHIFELGVTKVNDAGNGFVGSTYYFATDFVFNSQSFSIGPKIGGSIYFFAATLGSEIVFYTDFRDNTLHWVPYLGIGFASFRLFLAAHIPIYNRQYPVNAFSVGLTLPIFNLSRKRKW